MRTFFRLSTLLLQAFQPDLAVTQSLFEPAPQR